jgi:hypothetical protein
LRRDPGTERRVDGVHVVDGLPQDEVVARAVLTRKRAVPDGDGKDPMAIDAA